MLPPLCVWWKGCTWSRTSHAFALLRFCDERRRLFNKDRIHLVERRRYVPNWLPDLRILNGWDWPYLNIVGRTSTISDLSVLLRDLPKVAKQVQSLNVRDFWKKTVNGTILTVHVRSLAATIPALVVQVKNLKSAAANNGWRYGLANTLNKVFPAMHSLQRKVLRTICPDQKVWSHVLPIFATSTS